MMSLRAATSVRSWQWAVSAVVCLALATSCGGDDRADTIVFSAPADVTTLDPHDTADSQSDQVVMMVFDHLLTFNQEMQIVGQLATDWGVADDGVTWTFQLREGVTFHDGSPLNADAVKWSFDRVLDPALNMRRLPLFNMIDRVEVVDDHTVRFVTTYPFGAFEPTIAHVSAAILNPAVAGRYGKEFGRSAEATSGSGPYRIVRWRKDLELVLERNDDYWGEKGVTERIVYRPIPEASSRIIALETGDVDVISHMPPRDMGRLEQNDNLNVIKIVSIGAQKFRFNCARPPFDDPRVRLAVTHAIDRRVIIDNLMPGLAIPSTSALTPIMRGYARLGEIPYDPETSRRLLREAGYPNGFRTTISTTPRYNMGVELAEAVAAQLRQVGIEASIEVYDWATMVGFWAGLPPEKNPQEIFIMGAGASTADADWGLRPIFHTAPTNENNYGYYSNAEFDEVITAAMRETDAERRQALYRRAQEIVYLEDPGAFWMYDNYFIVATRTNVHGVTPYPLGVVTFEKAYKE